MSNRLIRNLSEVEQYVNTINPKLSCKVATTENITLINEQTIDGIQLKVGDRILVKNQNNSISDPENGIYICSSGRWIRSNDMNSSETCRLIHLFSLKNETNNNKISINW